jgi:hypothetical protein
MAEESKKHLRNLVTILATCWNPLSKCGDLEKFLLEI